MKIIENFLPKTYVEDLNFNMLGNQFPWYYAKETSTYNSTDNLGLHFVETKTTQDAPQFVHGLYANQTILSNNFSLVLPILHHVNDILEKNYLNKLWRCKANLLLRDSSYPKNNYHVAHTDGPGTKQEIDQSWISVLYYVNDSDGDTFIFNENLQKPKPKQLTIFKRIKPKKGTAIIFNANQFHASSSPKECNQRCVINFVLKDFED